MQKKVCKKKKEKKELLEKFKIIIWGEKKSFRKKRRKIFPETEEYQNILPPKARGKNTSCLPLPKGWFLLL